MNVKSKDQTEQTSNNVLENKLFRKNAFKEENNLLPKSLLKDLIEDESSSESLEEYSDRDGLENQATDPFTYCAMDEPKMRASTYNEPENARKGFKIGESFGANTNNKIFKVQSCSNEYQNFARPKITNISNFNTKTFESLNNSINTISSNSYNNTIYSSDNNTIYSSNNNTNNNSNNYFNNTELRNLSQEQNYMGKIPTFNNKRINQINNNTHNNINPAAGKEGAFNAVSRATSINRNNNPNNFNCNIGPQKQMNSNMHFIPMPGRPSFAQQACRNSGDNNCANSNCNCSNCFPEINPIIYGGCLMGKNVTNQICLCAICVDDSANADENSCGYYNANMISGNKNNINCVNGNINMLGCGATSQQHNSYMGFSHQQQQQPFDSNLILNQCRTHCNLNMNHPNFGIGNGNLIF